MKLWDIAEHTTDEKPTTHIVYLLTLKRPLIECLVFLSFWRKVCCYYKIAASNVKEDKDQRKLASTETKSKNWLIKTEKKQMLQKEKDENNLWKLQLLTQSALGFLCKNARKNGEKIRDILEKLGLPLQWTKRFLANLILNVWIHMHRYKHILCGEINLQINLVEISKQCKGRPKKTCISWKKDELDQLKL